jgi:hypothetical protein
MKVELNRVKIVKKLENQFTEFFYLQVNTFFYVTG